LPLWNVSSALAFLMWFGAAGYIAIRFAGLPSLLALLPAVGFGVVGALLVAAFLRVVLRGETEMNPAAYRMEGTLARVTVSIPAGGAGEIVFTKADRRRSEGARSIDGRPIARGEEVVVLDYQRGIALVQPWQDFISDGGTRAGEAPTGSERVPGQPAEQETER
jgi:membrane protein implicated in regulation of membrane protease activity